MKNINQYLKEAYTGKEAVEISQSPVTVLVGCDNKVKNVLNELEIKSVFDLATSRYFLAALEVCEAVEGRESIYFKYGKPNPDRFDVASKDLSLEELRNAEITIIQGIGPQTAAKIVAVLHITQVREMAFWPLFRNARAIVEEAYDIPEINDDPDAPKELLPEMGGYATEKYYYDKIFLYDTGMLAASPAPPKSGSPKAEASRSTSPGSSNQITGPLSLDEIENDDHIYRALGFGAIMTMEQAWYPQAVALGQLLHCLALAPAETTRIAVIDWSRNTTASLTDESSQIESLANTTEQNRSIGEITSGVVNEVQNGGSDVTTTTTSGGGGLSAGINLGIVKIGVGGGAASTKTHVYGSSFSAGTKSASSEMMQSIRSATQQHASSARTRRASVIHEVRQEENVNLQTRMVVNYNHSHALTVNYYEVVQMYRVITQFSKLRRCIFVPLQLLDFSKDKVLAKYRGVLANAALDDYTYQLLTNPGEKYLLKMELPKNILAAYQETDMEERRIAAGIEGAAEKGFWRLPDETMLTSILVQPQFMNGYMSSSDPEAEASAKIKSINVYMRHGGAIPRQLEPNAFGAGPADGVPIPFSEISSVVLDVEHGTVNNHLAVVLYLTLNGVEYRLRTNVNLARSSNTQITLFNVMAPLISDELVNRLTENRLYYSQAVWNSLDSQSVALLIAPYKFGNIPLASLVDTKPLTVHANYLVLPFNKETPLTKNAESLDDDLKKWNAWQQLHLKNLKFEEDIVPIPTGGVFAEAVLGRYNASEKLDLTRFWNWQDSPIPHLSETPQIAPISGESRQSTENLSPSSFAQPLINISNPTALPDPAGTTALFNLLGSSGTFRDMSGLSGIIDLAKIGSAGGNEVAKMSIMAANPSYLGALFNETEKKNDKKKATDKNNNATGTDGPDDDGGGNNNGGGGGNNGGGGGGSESSDPGMDLLATAGGTSGNNSGAVATVAGENGGYDDEPGMPAAMRKKFDDFFDANELVGDKIDYKTFTYKFPLDPGGDIECGYVRNAEKTVMYIYRDDVDEIITVPAEIYRDYKKDFFKNNGAGDATEDPQIGLPLYAVEDWKINNGEVIGKKMLFDKGVIYWRERDEKNLRHAMDTRSLFYWGIDSVGKYSAVIKPRNEGGGGLLEITGYTPAFKGIYVTLANKTTDSVAEDVEEVFTLTEGMARVFFIHNPYGTNLTGMEKGRNEALNACNRASESIRKYLTNMETAGYDAEAPAEMPVFRDIEQGVTIDQDFVIGWMNGFLAYNLAIEVEDTDDKLRTKFTPGFYLSFLNQSHVAIFDAINSQGLQPEPETILLWPMHPNLPSVTEKNIFHQPNLFEIGSNPASPTTQKCGIWQFNNYDARFSNSSGHWIDHDVATYDYYRKFWEPDQEFYTK